MNYYKDNIYASPKTLRELQACNKDTFLLGKLAEGRSYYPASETNEMISMMKGGGYSVVFHLEAVSTVPDAIEETFESTLEGLMFAGLDNHQGTAIKGRDYVSASYEEQVEFWYKQLKGKLIRFKPKITPRKGKSPFLNLEVDGIEGDYNGHSFYIPIPVVTMDNKLFEENLKRENYLIFPAYTHAFNSPELVICGDYIYGDFDYWQKHSTEVNTWKANTTMQKIRRIRLDDSRVNFFDYVGGGNREVVFFDESQIISLKHAIQDFGEKLGEKLETRTSTISVKEVMNAPTKLTTSIKPTTSVIKPRNDLENSEIGFLKNLQNTTLMEGLIYQPLDLVNFHVSVKTSPLTIVAGMTGTGKTQLVRTYAKALGMELLFLPITPSYLEPSDVLGYYNHSTKSFVPSETGLIDILAEAEQNPDKMYMVLFDEMNLSQVEHWFAPFLSLIELKPEERKLSLYSEQVECSNSDKYKSSIWLGENVRFVGTINLDETTKELSDRLLDRVNLVTLQEAPFEMLKQDKTNIKCSDYNFGANDFNSWVSSKTSADAYTMDELLFFNELRDVINNYDSQKGVSYRLINRIGMYINNLPVISSDNDKEFELTKSLAIDLGVKQGLLSKIKGSERQIGGLIGERTSSSDIGEKGELTILLESEQAQAVSSFENTLKEINRKALELGVHGFTS